MYHRGDFRSGKRLNMRRVIPFIASNYQNDRIWLRRVKLVDRKYQIIVAVDDSASMEENNCKRVGVLLSKIFLFIPCSRLCSLFSLLI